MPLFLSEVVTYDKECKNVFCVEKPLSLVSNLFCKNLYKQEKQNHATDEPISGEITKPLDQFI